MSVETPVQPQTVRVKPVGPAEPAPAKAQPVAKPDVKPAYTASSADEDFDDDDFGSCACHPKR